MVYTLGQCLFRWGAEERKGEVEWLLSSSHLWVYCDGMWDDVSGGGIYFLPLDLSSVTVMSNWQHSATEHLLLYFIWLHLRLRKIVCYLNSLCCQASRNWERCVIVLNMCSPCLQRLPWSSSNLDKCFSILRACQLYWSLGYWADYRLVKKQCIKMFLCCIVWWSPTKRQLFAGLWVWAQNVGTLI